MTPAYLIAVLHLLGTFCRLPNGSDLYGGAAVMRLAEGPCHTEYSIHNDQKDGRDGVQLTGSQLLRLQ